MRLDAQEASFALASCSVGVLGVLSMPLIQPTHVELTFVG